MVSREVIGAEALIRWQHPEGLLSPGAFLPEIEGSDLEIGIGEWVIDGGTDANRRLAAPGPQPAGQRQHQRRASVGAELR